MVQMDSTDGRPVEEADGMPHVENLVSHDVIV